MEMTFQNFSSKGVMYPDDAQIIDVEIRLVSRDRGLAFVQPPKVPFLQDMQGAKTIDVPYREVGSSRVHCSLSRK